MVTLDLSVKLVLDFTCVQCKTAMKLDLGESRGSIAVVRCQQCGFKIRIVPRPGVAQLPGIPAPRTEFSGRFPKLKPTRQP